MGTLKETTGFEIIDYDQQRLTALNSPSLKDLQWITSEVIEGYQMYLCTLYKNKVQEKNFVFLPWFFCFKINPAFTSSDAGQWRKNYELLRGLHLREKKIVGVLGDGSHWVLYELCSSKLNARVYDSLHHKQEYKVTQEGIPLVIEGISKYLHVSPEMWKVEFVEPHIRQTDDFNCGISCMLEMRKLLSTDGLEKILSLNSFRVEIRRDLSKSSREIFQLLNVKKNDAKKPKHPKQPATSVELSSNQRNQYESQSTNNKIIKTSNISQSLSYKSSVMLETIKRKFKSTISCQKVGVLTKDLVSKTSNDLTKKWIVNYRCLEDINITSNSYIGLLQNQSDFLVYHFFIRSQRGKIFDPYEYLRTSSEAKEGLQILLAEFNRLFALPHNQWSLTNVASGFTGFEAGISNIFDNISELDNELGKQDKVQKSKFGINKQETSTKNDEGHLLSDLKWTDPAKCGYCSAVFKQKKNLKSHNDLKHEYYPLFAIPVGASDNSILSDVAIEGSVPNYLSSTAKKRKLDKESVKTDSQNSVCRSYLKYKVEEIQNLVLQILKTPTIHVKTCKRDDFSESCSKLLKKSKSIDKILENFTWLKLVYSTDENQSQNKFPGLECKQCNKVRPGCGSFTYSYKNGSQFDKKETPNVTQPAAFCNLKENILDHVNTKTHRKVFNLPQLADKLSQNKTVDSQEITKEFIDDMFSNITTAILSLKPKPTEVAQVVKQTNARSDLESIISGSKSVEDLLKNCSILTVFPAVAEEEEIKEYSGFTCSFCYFGSRAGFFEYLCTNTDKKKFERLKTNIKHHLKTKTHLTNHPEMICDSDKNAEVAQKNQEIGLLLGRLAYKAVVSNQSYKKFEAEVAFMADAGVSVGDINHSHEFMSKIRPHFYQALKDHLKKILLTPLGASGKPSPFTLYADKMSPYGTTFQIIGIITMIAGENKAVVLSIKPVTNHTAEAIAKDLVDTLNDFYPPDVAKTLLASQSYDGQYIRMGVPLEVIKQLKIPYDTKLSNEQREKESWVTQSWDIMHLIELGILLSVLIKNYVIHKNNIL